VAPSGTPFAPAHPGRAKTRPFPHAERSATCLRFAERSARRDE